MIKLATDTIDKEDLNALADWLRTNPQLTKGPLVDRFETEFSAKMGVKSAVMVNSGSSANLLLLHALLCYEKISKGAKVVVPAISWATDLAPVIQLGLTPVLCDVNLSNIGVDIVKLEEIFQNEKPEALLLVSVLGMPPDMEGIDQLCKKYNVLLLEDNCESLGSKYDGHLLGTWGYASTTSLYFGHHISTVEGGMIFTNDESFAEVLRMTRAHGWDRDLKSSSLKDRLRENFNISEFNSRYTFYHSGFNFRPTEINAFLGLRQLQKLDDFVDKRRKNFEFLQYYIKNDYWKPFIAKEHIVSNLGYPVITPKRDKLVKAMTEVEIECRPFISGNMARQPVYMGWAEENNKPSLLKDYVNADLIHRFGMYLPNHPFLTEDDLYVICKTVNSKTA